MPGPSQDLLDAVFGDTDLLNIIIGFLKPLSDKPRAFRVCKIFCSELSKPAYNIWRAWIIQRSAYKRRFEAALFQTKCWCPCGCFRVESSSGCSRIFLKPACGHFRRLLGLIKELDRCKRDYDHANKAWSVPTSNLPELLGKVYRAEPDALLPGLCEPLAKLNTLGPPEPTDAAGCGDDLLRDASRFGGNHLRARVRPALAAREAAMREEEARLLTQRNTYLLRRAALQTLRQAMHAARAVLASHARQDSMAAIENLSLCEAMDAVRRNTGTGERQIPELTEAVALRSRLARVVALHDLIKTLAGCRSGAMGNSVAQRLVLVTAALRVAEKAGVDEAASLADAASLRDALTQEEAEERRREEEARRREEAARRAAAEAVARRQAAERLHEALATYRSSIGSAAQRLALMTAALRGAKAAGVDEAAALAEAASLRAMLVQEEAEERRRKEEEAAEARRREEAVRRTAAIEDLRDMIVLAWWMVAEPPDDAAEILQELDELSEAMDEVNSAGVAADAPLPVRSRQLRNGRRAPLLRRAAEEAEAELGALFFARAGTLCWCKRTRKDDGHHVCRYFGKFACRLCGNRWVSSYTYIDCGERVSQRCRRCRHATEPFVVRLLKSQRGGVGGGEHMAELCGQCAAIRRRTGDEHARCDDSWRA